MMSEKMQSRGEIVRASFVDTFLNNYYRLIAEIETGSKTGSKCYVSYRGDPSYLDRRGGKLIVRLDLPKTKISGLSLEDSDITGHFINSDPGDFEFARSNQIILL